MLINHVSDKRRNYVKMKCWSPQIPRLAHMFCANIHHEMEGIFRRGADPGVDQDLIMEQVRVTMHLFSEIRTFTSSSFKIIT